MSLLRRLLSEPDLRKKQVEQRAKKIENKMALKSASILRSRLSTTGGRRMRTRWLR